MSTIKTIQRIRFISNFTGYLKINFERTVLILVSTGFMHFLQGSNKNISYLTINRDNTLGTAKWLYTLFDYAENGSEV